jgi:hypothetical protein
MPNNSGAAAVYSSQHGWLVAAQFIYHWLTLQQGPARSLGPASTLGAGADRCWAQASPQTRAGWAGSGFPNFDHNFTLNPMIKGVRLPQCLIHIGMDNTATDLVRQLLALADQEKFLALLSSRTETGLQFESAGSTVETPALSEAWHDCGGSEAGLSGFESDASANLQTLLGKCGGRTTIVSGDALSFLDREAVQAFKDVLSRRFQSVQVLAHLAPPSVYIEQAFVQQLKCGDGRFDVSALYPHYRRRLEQWLKVFAADQIALIAVSPDDHSWVTKAEDLAARVGICVPPKQVWHFQKPLSLPAAQLLYTMGKMSAGPGQDEVSVRAEREVRAFLCRIEGEPLCLAPELLQPVLDLNAADLSWVEQQLGQAFAKPCVQTSNPVRNEADLLRYAPEAMFELMFRLRKSMFDLAALTKADRLSRRQQRDAADNMRSNRRRTTDLSGVD